MNYKSITIKASDYKYPSRAELMEVYKSTPDLHNFGFRSEHPITSLISKKRTIAEVHRADHLQYWNTVILGRNGALMRTCTHALVHFNRGIPDETELFIDHEHYVNRIQFDYYAEFFYHHFSTIKDTIGQILNVYYSIGVEVDKLHFNDKFLKKIPDQQVVDIISSFFEGTKLAQHYRNSYTHRFPIGRPDSRSSMTVENGRHTYGSATYAFIKTSEIKSNLDATISSLALLIDQLKTIF